MKREVVNFLCLAIFILGDLSFAYAYPPWNVATWRWRSDNGDVYSAAWMDSSETPIVVSGDENLRLRMLLYENWTEPYVDTTLLSLAYCEDSCYGGWVRITNLDTGKFFISQSEYLSDTVSYFDNQLLTPVAYTHPSGRKFAYLKTVAFDSTDSWLLAGQDTIVYELEYCLRATARVKPHSAYFFTLIDSLYEPVRTWQGLCSYPVLLTSPVGWNTQSSGTKASLYGVSSVDQMVGTAVGDSGTILRTTDGGTTWNSQSGGTAKCLRAAFFPDANAGFSVGDSGTILHTTDGGKNWNSQSASTAVDFHALYFADPKRGTIVGNSGAIFRTINAGETWSLQFGNKSFHLLAVDFVNEDVGIAVGTSGAILRTIDGGVRWISQSSGFSGDLVSVLVSDANTATVVANSGAVLRTVDGGKHWVLKRSGLDRYLASAEVIDADHLFGVGGSGLILATADSTLAWERLASSSSLALNAVDFADRKNGWVVGDRGTILKTTNGGATGIQRKTNQDIPKDFSLAQNYPNPFNPTTAISYQLSAVSHVSLKVYDILGREVATLVNKKQGPGTYEVRFDASGLSSGVYFYRIKAGAYTSVKKMLMLK